MGWPHRHPLKVGECHHALPLEAANRWSANENDIIIVDDDYDRGSYNSGEDDDLDFSVFDWRQ
jgi:hypothetical protein